MIANTTLVANNKNRNDIEYIFVPISKQAEDLGNIKMANMLALGVLAKVSNLLTVNVLEQALDKVLPPHRKKMLPMNKKAMEMGYKYDLLPINC